MFIKKRNKFITEEKVNNLILEKKLDFSSKFISFLMYNLDNPIYAEISKNINKDVGEPQYDYIDISNTKNDEVLFIQGSKLKNAGYVDYDSDYTNTTMKIGRFLRSLYKLLVQKEPKDKDIEDAVNLYKAVIDTKFKNLKIVNGEDIRKYYLFSSYASDKGSLGQSCMRYTNSQNLLDLYVEEENINMLILLNEDGALMGRALVWKLDDGDTFMDRIYSESDSDVEIFKMYAIKNNWIYKKEQSYKNESNIIKNKQVHTKPLLYQAKKVYSLYPYLDTLKFLGQKGELYSIARKDKIEIMLAEPDGTEIVYSEYEKVYLNRLYVRHSEKFGWLNEDKCKMVNDEWYPIGELIMDVYGHYDLKEELAYNSEFDFYYPKGTELMEIDFFDKKVKYPEGANFIIYSGSKKNWEFNLFKYQKYGDEKYEKVIFGDYKKIYDTLLLLIDRDNIKDTTTYKVIMSYKNTFKLGKTIWNEYRDFKNLANEFSFKLLDIYGKGELKNVTMRDFDSVIFWYFYQEFNKINYPELVNMKQKKSFIRKLIDNI